MGSVPDSMAPYTRCRVLAGRKEKQGKYSAKSQCFEVPDKFVVGYGIGYAGAYRNLLDLCLLKDEGFSSLEVSLIVPMPKIESC